MTRQRNDPFFVGTRDGIETYYVDAASRLDRVREFTKAQCEAVLRLPGVQKAVRVAAERRIKKLASGKS